MPVDHKEIAFETAIEHHLTTAGGYVKGDRDGFDPHRAIFPADVLTFIKSTQPDEWAYLEGIQKAKAEERNSTSGFTRWTRPSSSSLSAIACWPTSASRTSR